MFVRIKTVEQFNKEYKKMADNTYHIWKIKCGTAFPAHWVPICGEIIEISPTGRILTSGEFYGGMTIIEEFWCEVITKEKYPEYFL